MKKAPPSAPRRSSCAIACTLDLVGDRWTLLVVRDLLRGMTRYGEFLGGEEGIPTNVLAERLVRLEGAQLITRQPYQENPPRFAYQLTAKGRGLARIIGALALWGEKNLPGTGIDPELHQKVRAMA